MSDDLLRYRSEFPILERTTYLISNSLGAMPRGVYDAIYACAPLSGAIGASLVVKMASICSESCVAGRSRSV